MMIDKRRMIVRLKRWLTSAGNARGRRTAARPPPVCPRSSPRPPPATSGPSGHWPPSLYRSSSPTVAFTSAQPRPLEQVAQGISRKILKTLPSYLRSRAPFWGYVYGVTARAVADAQRYTAPEHSDPVHMSKGRPASSSRPRLRPIAGPATRDPPSRAAGSPRPASTAPTQRRRHRQDHRNVARHRTAHPTPRTQPATPRTTNGFSRPVLPDMIAYGCPVLGSRPLTCCVAVGGTAAARFCIVADRCLVRAHRTRWL